MEECVIAMEEHKFGDATMQISRDDGEGVWCESCKQNVVGCPVVSIDTSRGEHGALSLCKWCLIPMLQYFEWNSSSSEDLLDGGARAHREAGGDGEGGGGGR